GNRFDDGFSLNLTSPATTLVQGPGANLARLLPLLQSVPNGLMIGIPQAPRNLRIISSGKQRGSRHREAAADCFQMRRSTYLRRTRPGGLVRAPAGCYRTTNVVRSGR